VESKQAGTRYNRAGWRRIEHELVGWHGKECEEGGGWGGRREESE
jgi:hypothetical protein